MATNLEKLGEMSPEELSKEEMSLREEIWKLRIQLTTGQLQDPQRVRRSRKELARVLTVRRQQELAATRGSES
ncbi:MAG: 50S ribosomal protein L29 [Acidobacteriota bacterium]|nr:50S ribosomal protein L29 [Acidobacteriota bacterium]MDH3785522.1 50S ribosomal protein L29 [Acidobacteriota bacterium]